jgi:hypothetical protein
MNDSHEPVADRIEQRALPIAERLDAADALLGAQAELELQLQHHRNARVDRGNGGAMRIELLARHRALRSGPAGA